MSKKCHLCGRRRGRRACPALGHSICAVCCGTKRLVEVDCPSDCAYLLSSQSHPPASVQRQRERDLRFLFPLLGELTEPQQRLILAVQGLLLNDRQGGISLTDNDVAEATKALADTYETASRGIIYDHGTTRPAAEHLSGEIKALIETQRKEGLRIGDADVAGTLRRIETGARQAAAALAGESAETAYLDLLKRLLRVPAPTLEDGNSASETGSDSRLIVPG